MPTPILFDLDGTLVDSVADLTATLNTLHDELGRRHVSEDEVRGWVGEGASLLVGRALAGTGAELSGAQITTCVARFMEIYRGASAVHTRPYPGVVRLLETLAASGTPMAVVTNKPYVNTMLVLEALDLARFFPVVIGADSGPTRKPDAGPLRAAMAGLGVNHAVMVGDSHIDVAAARAAGVPVFVVAWGYAHGDPERLGADRVIRRVEDLAVLELGFRSANQP